MYDHLRQRGKEFGIIFGDRTILPNSRLALEASEYARDVGKYEQFHEQVFQAYFTEIIDIGNTEKLCAVATRCDLDVIDMMNALKDRRYKSRLDEAKQEGLKINLTGVPTFIINGKHKIVGAQPVEVFTDLIEKLPLTEVIR
jgi:predicted DsbA family dithiol-disulfide isomerase